MDGCAASDSRSVVHKINDDANVFASSGETLLRALEKLHNIIPNDSSAALHFKQVAVCSSWWY